MNREELMPHRALLIKLYIEESDISVDRLPYSSDFENIYRIFLDRSKISVTRYDLYQELVSLRKSGLLPTKKKRIHLSCDYT